MSDESTTTEAPSETPKGPTITTRSSVEWWLLQGPACQALDVLVSALVDAGLPVEAVTATTRYRFRASEKYALGLGDEVVKLGPGFTVGKEQPPTDRLHLCAVVAPARVPRRVTYVHGTLTAYAFVARALDHGLTVAPAGIIRYAVTGPSGLQMRWLAAVQKLSVDDVLKQWNTTAEAIAAEDSTGLNVSLPVTVTLPDRRVETEMIEHDEDGNLKRVVQIERSV